MASPDIGTLSPNPWDLTLSGQDSKADLCSAFDLRPAPSDRQTAIRPLAGFQVATYGRFWVATEENEFRRQFGPAYKPDMDLIFANPDGSPLKPDSVSASASLLFRRLKLPKGASLHSLRTPTHRIF
jgi:hypothetical protein